MITTFLCVQIVPGSYGLLITVDGLKKIQITLHTLIFINVFSEQMNPRAGLVLGYLSVNLLTQLNPENTFLYLSLPAQIVVCWKSKVSSFLLFSFYLFSLLAIMPFPATRAIFTACALLCVRFCQSSAAVA